MEMRDRLIGLLKGAFRFHIDDPYCIPDAEDFADDLIKGGVVMIPCKVGDVVYQVYDGGMREEVITDITIVLDRYDPPYIKCDTRFKTNGYIYNSFFNCYLLGETVFLTKEEAEAKLKESEGNG